MMTATLSCVACGAAIERDSRACGHCGTVAARRRCGTCFDLNFPDDQACRRCGGRLPTVHGEPGDGPAPCPGCGAEMSPRSLDGLPFTECDRCGGLWLTPAVLERVKDRASARARQRTLDTTPSSPRPAAAAAADRVVYRRCPACRTMMNRSHLAAGSGFVADLCKEHGIFFDAGELARLFSFVESGGLVRARRREEEALRARVSEARREAFQPGQDDPLPGEPPSLLEELMQIAGRWFARR